MLCFTAASIRYSIKFFLIGSSKLIERTLVLKGVFHANLFDLNNDII